MTIIEVPPKVAKKKPVIKTAGEMKTVRITGEGTVQSIEGGKIILKEKDGGHVYTPSEAVARFLSSFKLNPGDIIHFDYEKEEPDGDRTMVFFKLASKKDGTPVNTLAIKQDLSSAVKEGEKKAVEEMTQRGADTSKFGNVPSGTKVITHEVPDTFSPPKPFRTRENNPRIGWYACINSAIEIQKAVSIPLDENEVIRIAKKLHDFVEEQVKE